MAYLIIVRCERCYPPLFDQRPRWFFTIVAFYRYWPPPLPLNITLVKGLVHYLQ